MMQFGISDILFLAPYCLGLFFLTYIYFQFNTGSLFIKGSTVDKKFVITQISKKNYNIVFIRISVALLVLILLQVFVYHGFCTTF